MSDIVGRLRRNKSELQADSSLHDTGECREVMSEAADEISQLRHEVEDLRKLVRHYEMELMRTRA